MAVLSREAPIDPAHAALLIIDVQNYCISEEAPISGYFRHNLQTAVLPNIRRLQLACRQAGIEVLYSVIENITRDGRDRSLDYKISGIEVPRGSWEAGARRDSAGRGRDDFPQDVEQRLCFD